MSASEILLFGVPGLLAIGFVVCVLIYNRFVHIRVHVREGWSAIDVELKRRYELIPNLVETVRGYARHERELFEEVTRLRSVAQANEGDHGAQAADETRLMLCMKRLFAVVEAYPQLKASENFRKLQEELALTEDRIAAARRFYNANVRDMNQLRAMFPTNLVAIAMGIRPESFFELDSEAERVVPRASHRACA